MKHARPKEGQQSGFTWRSVVVDVPAPVWVIIALHVSILCAYTILVPNYRGPDEYKHVDLAVGMAHGDVLPWPDPGTQIVRQGVKAGGWLLPPREKRIFSAEIAAERDQRRTLSAAGGDAPTKQKNQLVGHPPLFYLLIGGVLAIWPGWESGVQLDVVVGILRVLNLLMVAPLPLLCHAAVRRLRGAGPAAVVAAVIPLAIPELSRVSTTVNNDNLLNLLMALVGLLAVFVLTGDISRRTALLIGVFGGLALLTKGLALYLPLWLAAIYLVAARRYGIRRSLPPAIIAQVVSLGLGGWWWVRNELRYGRMQPDGAAIAQPGGLPPKASLTDQGLMFAERFLKSIEVRYWLPFRSQEPPSALLTLATIATGLLVAGILVGVVVRTARITDMAVLLIPTICPLAIVAYGSWQTYQRTLAFGGLQGRYLFSGILGLAVLTAIGCDALSRRVRQWLPLLVLAFAAMMHLAMARIELSYYWLPLDDRIPWASRLRSAVLGMLEWAPWPPLVTTAVWAGALTAAAVAAQTLGRYARYRASPSTADPHWSRDLQLTGSLPG